MSLLCSKFSTSLPYPSKLKTMSPASPRKPFYPHDFISCYPLPYSPCSSNLILEHTQHTLISGVFSHFVPSSCKSLPLDIYKFYSLTYLVSVTYDFLINELYHWEPSPHTLYFLICLASLAHPYKHLICFIFFYRTYRYLSH